MARPNLESIQTFMSITGASESVALQKLEEHSGDLNEAVNAYFGEGDTTNSRSTSVPGPQNDFMNIDDPLNTEAEGPLSLSLPSAARRLNPFSLLDSSFARSIFDQRGTADFSNRSPLVSHPREVREIPIEFKDGNGQSGCSSSRPIIEDVTGSTIGHGLQEVHGNVIIDDEDDRDFAITPAVRTAPSAPQSNNITDYGNDIEEEMLKAAIEASKWEAEGEYSDYQFDFPLSSSSRLEHRPSDPEDIELARAVSLSLKTAEQEKALHDWERVAGLAGTSVSNSSSLEEQGIMPTTNGRNTSTNIMLEAGNSSVQKAKNANKHPFTRLWSRHSTGVAESAKESGELVGTQKSTPEPCDVAGQTQRNGDAFHFEEWGGISSEEHDEAVMLETALFGGAPDGNAHQFAHPSHQSYTSSNGNQGLYSQRVPHSQSPTLAEERSLREQQNDEYLASLLADQEKETKAREEAQRRHLEEAAAREASLQKQKQEEEEAHRKLLEEEDIERVLAEKQASLPQEPSADDESAVTLLVRMPDGSRRGRRFLKSDRLQSLFDFMDIGKAVKPGTYRLVRAYPRRAFENGESELSLSELGLTSKQEALFLEII